MAPMVVQMSGTWHQNDDAAEPYLPNVEVADTVY